MLVGQLICARCGKDCSKLWGFMLGVRGQIRDRMMQQELDKVKEEFGQCEFAICWGCTAKAFGIKTLAEKKELEEQNAEQEVLKDKEETITERLAHIDKQVDKRAEGIKEPITTNTNTGE